MCISTFLPTNDCNLSSYPIFTTPTKETNCSLNLTIPNTNITPHNYNICDDNYYSSSTMKNCPQTLKQVIFNIEKSKSESSSDSSMTQYLKPNYNNIIHQSHNFNIKIIPSTPAKKNLSSIFENAVSSSSSSQNHLITPININKKKNLFECSSSSTFYTTTTKKKKRLRKNKKQIETLNLFYSYKNCKWSKAQIKRISEEIGLKEKKVYKWLWDKRNKECKHNKFYIHKINI